MLQSPELVCADSVRFMINTYRLRNLDYIRLYVMYLSHASFSQKSELKRKVLRGNTDLSISIGTIGYGLEEGSYLTGKHFSEHSLVLEIDL